MAKLIRIKQHAQKYKFDIEDLLQASAEVLGKGTFGTTYKAELRTCTVAVKRLRDVVISEEDFKDRVESLGAMKHLNVLRPLAYYYTKDEKLVVYEYMPKGSLSSLLHGHRGTPPSLLEWDTRCRITLAVARGVSYIHLTDFGSHGDIKSSNILLDEFKRAYVSDCGLTSLVYLTAKSPTPNYAPPDVRDFPKASQKADVYNFGILLLELLTRKAPVLRSLSEEDVDLPRWVQSVDRERWSSEILDVELRSESVEEEMVQMLQLGIDCTKQNPDKRPSMGEVVAKIEEICHLRLEKWDQAFNQQLEILSISSDNDENDSGGGIKQELEAGTDSPFPHPTSTSSPAGGYKIKKFKFASLLPWVLPKLRSTSGTSQNYKINKHKEPTKWEGITTFTYSALAQATSNFNKSNELGEGGFGKVYRGDLLCTKVAIKILHREGDASQEQAFRREVDTLCRVSHPHLVQLMGVCPEKYALVYEFMEGGTLEDHLVRKDISWQVRIRIAAEICSALVFLHSRKPDIVVHGDLKPANILLDASGTSKLGDFGICRIISPSNTTTTAHITATRLQGSDGYMDPVLKQNGKLQPSIDVYAFGMIALRLLTNDRPGHALVIDVEEALSEERLKDVLDPTAGWPSQLAEELSDLAIKCCDLHVKRRPHLQEVCEKLEEMRNKASSA